MNRTDIIDDYIARNRGTLVTLQALPDEGYVLDWPDC